jgi:hypothetical protein
MKKNQPWTDQELSQIKLDFLRGEKIKVIAHKLGRSFSSLNKALSRYGIRNLKNSNHKGYIEWDPRANYCKDKLPGIIKYKTAQPKENRIKNKQLNPCKISKKTIRLKDDGFWVSLSEVVNYIKSKGISIENLDLAKNSIPSAYPGSTFFLDHKPSSPLKVVLFANKLRLEEGKQTFLTKEVTW